MILHRVLEWKNEVIAIEAGLRHAEVMLQELTMQSQVMEPPPIFTDPSADITQSRSLASRCDFDDGRANNPRFVDHKDNDFCAVKLFCG